MKIRLFVKQAICGAGADDKGQKADNAIWARGWKVGTLDQNG